MIQMDDITIYRLLYIKGGADGMCPNKTHRQICLWNVQDMLCNSTSKLCYIPQQNGNTTKSIGVDHDNEKGVLYYTATGHKVVANSVHNKQRHPFQISQDHINFHTIKWLYLNRYKYLDENIQSGPAR